MAESIQERALAHLSEADMFLNSGINVLNDLEQRLYEVSGAVQGAKTQMYMVDDSGEGVLGDAQVAAQSSIGNISSAIGKIMEIRGQLHLVKDKIAIKRSALYSSGQ